MILLGSVRDVNMQTNGDKGPPIQDSGALRAAGPVLDLPDGAVLRPVRAEDVTPAYPAGLNDPEVGEFLSAPRAARQTVESVRAYVRDNEAASNAVLFGIWVGHVLRGTVRLHDLDGHMVRIGVAIFDRAVWGQGWGHRAVSAVTEWALRELGVAEVIAGVDARNERSRRCFARAGFRHDPARDVRREGFTAEQWVRRA